MFKVVTLEDTSQLQSDLHWKNVFVLFNSLYRLSAKLHSNEVKGSMRNVTLSGHSQRAWMSSDSMVCLS